MKNLKKKLSDRLHIDSHSRWIFSGLIRSPLRFPFAFFRSLIATKALTGNWFPVKVRLAPRQVLLVKRGKNSEVIIEKVLKIVAWGGDLSNSSISLSENARLAVKGRFEIGPGVHFSVGRNAQLEIEGQQYSSASGITSRSRIMVERSIRIGADCIIAWDVTISDSDWHNISGTERIKDTTIGDSVWIAHGVSVLKGAYIPNGCVVGAKSMVAAGAFPEKSLLAGIPAKVIRSNVEWKR